MSLQFTLGAIWSRIRGDEMSGMMCGIDDACEWLQNHIPDGDDMPVRIVNRLRYVQNKDTGVKPKYHKGTYGKKYDWWSCGNCGHVIRGDVGDNYCQNCGYRILWDSPRCLTGVKESDD